jgi:hypothetical protein
VPASEIYLGIPTEPPDLIAIDSLDHFTIGPGLCCFAERRSSCARAGSFSSTTPDATSNCTAEPRRERSVHSEAWGPGSMHPQWTDVFFY